MKESDWDPSPDEKTFYRSTQDGQRGYLVRRGGKDVIRLDRPMQEIIHPMNGTWVADVQIHPLTAHAVAAVAFAADRALCKAMGTVLPQKDGEWLSQKEKDRIKWMEKGPQTDDVREDLYDAIMGTLGPLTDG